MTNLTRHNPYGLARTLALALALILLPLAAQAGGKGEYAVKDVPNIHLQDARQYVSDPSAILSAAARDTINATLARLERQTGIESAVVMLPGIGEDDIFDFAHELFRSWGIGKKKSNNGLLFLFVMDQRKIRITTGYGLEATLTDAISKRIQMQYMVPRFKEGNWDAGMVDGVKAAAKVLDGSMQPDGDDEDDGDIAAVLIVMAIVIGVVMAIAVIGARQICPKCRKKGVKMVAEHKMRLSNGHRIIRRTYICPHCGHTFTRDIEDTGGGGAAAFIAGSMLGGGSSGSRGFSGGSFGGGSTGGGGSTSGW